MYIHIHNRIYVYIHNRILLSHKKEWKFVICNSMVRFGGHMLSEINQTEKSEYCNVFTYIWNLKKTTN